MFSLVIFFSYIKHGLYDIIFKMFNILKLSKNCEIIVKYTQISGYYFVIKIMEINYDKKYLLEIPTEYFISNINAIKYY